MSALISMATCKFHSARSHRFQEDFRNSILSRKRNGVTKVRGGRAKLSERNVKKANLCATSRERIKIPSYGNGENNIYHISQFLSHPSGVEAVLNIKALLSYQPLVSNLYRCILPQVKFLNFEVAPVIDLQVTPTAQDCVVEMISCKFEGSDVVELFSASMRSNIRWETIASEQFLDVNVRLDLVIENDASFGGSAATVASTTTASRL